jgi:transketolase
MTSEDHNTLNGLGSQVARVTARHCPVPVFCHGVQDTFGESGEPEELAEKYGLSAPSILRQLQDFLAQHRN